MDEERYKYFIDNEDKVSKLFLEIITAVDFGGKDEEQQVNAFKILSNIANVIFALNVTRDSLLDMLSMRIANLTPRELSPTAIEKQQWEGVDERALAFYRLRMYNGIGNLTRNDFDVFYDTRVLVEGEIVDGFLELIALMTHIYIPIKVTNYIRDTAFNIIKSTCVTSVNLKKVFKEDEGLTVPF